MRNMGPFPCQVKPDCNDKKSTIAALKDRDVVFRAGESYPALTAKLNKACPAMALRSNTLAADLRSPRFDLAALRDQCKLDILVPLFGIAAPFP